MSVVNITVSRFTVQYMLKENETDRPMMLPMNAYSVDLTLEVPDELSEYVPLYIKGFEGLDPNGAETRIIPEYNAPREVVKKWKKYLKTEYPDSFDSKPMPDMVIDSAISCTLEDAIKDALDELWDNTLAKTLNAEPDIPEGYRLGSRYIHLESWNVK